MYNKFHFAFHLRTDGIADKGFPFIYAKVVLNGNRVNLGSTGIRVTPDNWDARSKRLKATDAISMAHNTQLETLESQVRSLVLYAESRQEVMTPDKLKKGLRPASERQAYVLKLVDTYLQWSEQMKATGHAADKTHETRKDKLNVFLRYLDAKKKTHLLAEELKPAVFEDFKNWMLLKRGSKESYASKCQQFLKTFIRWCYRNGHIEADPSASYAVKVDRTPILENLSEEELKRLRETVFTDRLQETVDCYLFACYTGLAYIDMKLLSKASIVVEKGKEYLKGSRQKTDTHYFVPLSKVAKAIISKYGGIDKLPLRSNPEVNAMLKVAMAQIGVNRRIWFHTARKTFAMRMQNVLRVSDETTAAMMGHKNTKELKLYRNITKDRVIGEMGDIDF